MTLLCFMADCTETSVLTRLANVTAATSVTTNVHQPTATVTGNYKVDKDNAIVVIDYMSC